MRPRTESREDRRQEAADPAQAVPADSRRPEGRPIQTPTDVPDLLDLDAARQRLPGGSELLKETLQIMLEECPKLLQEIRESLESQDPQRLRRAAHTLKGSADVFAAKPVVAAAQQMEIMAKQGDLDNAKAVLDKLEAEVERLCVAIGSVILSF